ncbi:MAG: alpha/beta hydrolase [Vicinamibacterales bacterium]
MTIGGRILLRRAAVVLMLLLALGYAGAAGYLRWSEHALVYQPGSRQVDVPPERFALRERRVTYPSSGGAVLSAWVIPARPQHSAAQWMLICHGNYGNVGFGQRPEFYAFMRDLDVNLFAFDYRGFGESTGTPSEQAFYDDAEASYGYLIRTLGVRPDQIVIFGHSLGSAVAIELATHSPASALIVDGAFTSVVERAAELYPLLPISLVATQRFPSIDRIASVVMPKLFLHSPDDMVIPYALGLRLFEAARPPKQFVAVRGGHENAFKTDQTVYYGAIARLLREVAPVAARP